MRPRCSRCRRAASCRCRACACVRVWQRGLALSAPHPPSPSPPPPSPPPQLYVANLQDYSYHIGQLVSLTPSQFCRAALHYRRGRRLDAPLTSLALAKPALYEARDDAEMQPEMRPR